MACCIRKLGAGAVRTTGTLKRRQSRRMHLQFFRRAWQYPQLTWIYWSTACPSAKASCCIMNYNAGVFWVTGTSRTALETTYYLACAVVQERILCLLNNINLWPCFRATSTTRTDLWKARPHLIQDLDLLYKWSSSSQNNLSILSFSNCCASCQKFLVLASPCTYWFQV